MSNTRELDPLIDSFTHDVKRPREKEALVTLKKIASLVKPIMRARGWRVKVLAEMYPDQQNLLGLNYNKGQKICLRLRYPGDANQFLPLEQVVDTMLHELSHNVFGAHDAKFNALWDKLREEYEDLQRKGYTGEGFLSEGKRLGGRSVPRDEARRIARNAAEKRKTLSAGSGQRLGGAGVRPGQDVRRVIVDAIERRATVNKGCGTDKKSNEEIKKIADEATSSGFRTKAEEDKANEEAISQALWELCQEDQKVKYGNSYLPTTAENPLGSSDQSFGASPSKPIVLSPTHKRLKTDVPANDSGPGNPVSQKAPTVPSSTKPPPKKEPTNPFHSLPSAAQSRPVSAPPSTDANPFARLPETINSPSDIDVVKWICPQCTCHNPEQYLCCDACEAVRPPAESREYVYNNAGRPRPAAKPSKPAKPLPKMWTCHRCSTRMEEKWWSCSTCSTVKQSSK